MTRILVGDARERLRELPDGSVHCCITSPPYWGLRSYEGEARMVGLEPTLTEHIENLVAIFREVRRVLRDDGTLWLNYGDAYASSPPGNKAKGLEKWKTSGLQGGNISEQYARTLDQSHGQRKDTIVGSSLKAKDLLMMPARVALALQADGWWLRSEIVWAKPNPMPESVTDRPTSAHEKVFLLSKKAKYFYDADAVRQPLAPSSLPQMNAPYAGKAGKVFDDTGAQDARAVKARITANPPAGANLRNVWTIPTHSFPNAHFATFPPMLVEPCMKAGTSERGVCRICGAPRIRDTDKELVPTSKAAKTFVVDERDLSADSNSAGNNRQKDGHQPGWINRVTTVGWKSSCDHEADIVPATVLDPFGGAGTVGLVTQRLQRDAVLVEISPKYAQMAADRILNDAPLLAQVEVI